MLWKIKILFHQKVTFKLVFKDSRQREAKSRTFGDQEKQLCLSCCQAYHTLSSALFYPQRSVFIHYPHSYFLREEENAEQYFLFCIQGFYMSKERRYQKGKQRLTFDKSNNDKSKQPSNNQLTDILPFLSFYLISENCERVLYSRMNSSEECR